MGGALIPPSSQIWIVVPIRKGGRKGRLRKEKMVKEGRRVKAGILRRRRREGWLRKEGRLRKGG
jgi:hypothetical protein